MVAAMAMSPFAALSLPLVQNPTWIDSISEFGERLRSKVRDTVDGSSFQKWASSVDEGLTFMEWTYKYTGVDLTYIWDPELWVKFKQAVWADEPEIFWNELADRIQYKGVIPQAGIVGDMRISYSKFLQLLEANRVKRVVVYGDMKTAVVEVPHPWTASIMPNPDGHVWYEDKEGKPLNLLIPNPQAPDDPLQWYCPEMPEWNMEKYRFYVDLPGDFWDSGVMLRYLRSREVQVLWDERAGHFVLPHEAFNKVFQVKTELQVLDPSESWDFMSWLLQDNKVEFYEKAAAVCVFGRSVTIALNLLTGTPAWKMWRTRKKKKKSKEENMWERLTASTAREFMTKDAKTGKMRDTGVRFADIAGLDHIVLEMREVVKMLLNDPQYAKVGAKCPRGIIFQGPPGTGKTYLARAIAGEAGVTFYSAVGSEFVEMFAGVAAARVNNLFSTARKRAPAIIFIDEIDAIGRARSALGSDPGSMERESALLAMLVQMDGIHGKLEQVLTIGATNLAQELDQALLRPGRFEVVYEIPSPGPVARLEILRYHSRNKSLDDTAMLARVAEVTQGWSAASLANLMNEAAILTVRRGVDKISLPMVMELVEGLNWGTRAARIPPSEAKDRLAMVTAAKAVAFALTPGLDPIKFVTLWSQRRGLGPYVEFTRSEENLEPGWHPEMPDIMDFTTNIKTNAASIGDERLGEFLHVASLLIPLYAPRACELAFFGKEGVSLATAAPIADCFEIGYHCVRNSMVHPRFKSMPPLHTFIWLGEDAAGVNQRDPLAVGLNEELGYHTLTLTLLKASWRRTQKLVAERRSAIIKVAEEMLSAKDERISGTRLVEIIESTPLDDASDISIDNDFMPILKEVLGRVPNVVLEGSRAADEDQQQPAAGSSSSTAPASMPTRLVTDATTTFRAAGAGATGSVSFSRPQAPSTSSVSSATTTSQPASQPAPELKLDDATLLAVSKAIMGRLDVVDLVGRNTAYEIAERVRDALLDPETVQRLSAVRRYVEDMKAEFPPAPLEAEISGPLYGEVSGSLEYWKRRVFSNISWSAVEMLYTQRQLNYFKQDMDVPRFEDTSRGKKAKKEKEAAASRGQ